MPKFGTKTGFCGTTESMKSSYSPLFATRLPWARLRPLLSGVLLAGLAAASAGAASKDDEKPALISKTGGGGQTWTDVPELEAAAKKGNPRAWAQLGELRLKGDRTLKDVPDGLNLLEKAARAGEASAAFALGKVYDDGDLAPADRVKALDYYRAAAAGKVPEAFFNLGAAYSSGRGVKRDYAEGLAWLILAKRAGLENEGESKLRERIVAMRRPQLIETGERRAEEIADELVKGSVASFLPGAVKETPVKAQPSRLPRLQTKPEPIKKIPLGRDGESRPSPALLPPPALPPALVPAP